MRSNRFILLLGLMACASISQGQTYAPWQALSGTTLRSVCPANNALGSGTYAYAFNDQCPNVINAWNSAVMDTKRNSLIIWGGGHSDYHGNEVYRLDLNGTPSIRRLNNPSQWDLADSNAEVNPDGTPATRHTWGGLVYLPKNDVMFAFEGSLFGSASTRKTWFLHFNADGSINTSIGASGWVDKLPGGVNLYAGGGSTHGAHCVLDTTFEDGNPANDATEEYVLCHWGSNNALLRYSVTANTWTALTTFAQTILPSAASIVLDPYKKGIWAFGNNYNTADRNVKFVSLLPGSTYTVQDMVTNVTGCDAIAANDEPGLVFDPVINKIVAYGGTGNTVYIFDPQTRTCVGQTWSGGPTGSAGQNANGVLGRWAYSLALGKYVVLNDIDANAYTFTLTPTAKYGLGSSTMTCLDKDGDGYGVGRTSCLGQDADDNDASVHTGAEALAKYGTMQAFVEHLGYPGSRIWYLSAAGNNGTCQVNTPALPCQTLSFSGIQVGDMFMMRDGFWMSLSLAGGGQAGKPYIFLSYPGEMAVFDKALNAAAGMNLNDDSWVVFDGVITMNGAFIVTGTGGPSYPPGGAGVAASSTSHNNIFRRIESYDVTATTGGNTWNISAHNGIDDVLMENNVFHDNGPGTEHCVYVGSRQLVTTSFIFRQNILYNCNHDGLHMNGRMIGSVVSQNLIHSGKYDASIQGIDFQMGNSKSYVWGNVVLDYGNSSMAIGNYANGACAAFFGEDTESLTQHICPYDQTGNIIENNVFYQSGNGFGSTPGGSISMGGSMNVSIYNWAGKNTSPFPSASSPSYEGFVGGNTFRNNIMGTYGLTSTKQHVRYYQNYINPGDTTDCDATCQAWAAGDKWVNNIFYKTGGTTSGTTLVRLGNGNGTFSDYNCSTLAGAVNTNANCLFSNPQFVNDTITNWSNPQLYDFRLQSSSPAKNAGTQAPNSPVFDIVGNRFSVGAPSIGAYEFIAASILNRHGGTRISGGTVR